MSDPSPSPQRSRSTDSRGLYSVAQVQHLLRIEFARAQRYAYPLSCLVLAVDQLDALRDAHGYEFKELVLGALVDLLRRSTRSSDFMGRTADDRLIVLLPHTSAAGARTLAARLIEHAGALDLERGGARARISLSIGVSALAGSGLLFHDALHREAELALAEAIAAGGGRLVERVVGGQA